jgi:hypothetical protein
MCCGSPNRAKLTECFNFDKQLGIVQNQIPHRTKDNLMWLVIKLPDKPNIKAANLEFNNVTRGRGDGGIDKMPQQQSFGWT